MAAGRSFTPRAPRAAAAPDGSASAFCGGLRGLGFWVRFWGILGLGFEAFWVLGLGFEAFWVLGLGFGTFWGCGRAGFLGTGFGVLRDLGMGEFRLYGFRV